MNKSKIISCATTLWIRALYLFTLFLICAAVTTIITSALHIHEPSQSVLVIGTAVLLILGCFDLYLVLNRHWSPTIVLWVIPILIFCLIKTACRKEQVLEYPVATAKNIACSALNNPNHC